MPIVLFSLANALLSNLGLTSLELVESLLDSPLGRAERPLGARHVPTFQTTPVKLFTWKAFRSHLRQGLPDRSSARNPALIAPWLALGPSLCGAMGATLANGPPLIGPFPWSIVPSGLGILCQRLL